MRKIKWVLIGIVAVGFVGVALCVWFTHGYFWSFREMAFRRLLRSLPEPPGWRAETNLIATSGYSPSGYRSYDVVGESAQVVEFFKKELPQMDWHLYLEVKDDAYYDHIRSTSLFFAYQESHCLRINLGTRVNDLGIQQEDRVWFHATIKEKVACIF